MKNLDVYLSGRTHVIEYLEKPATPAEKAVAAILESLLNAFFDDDLAILCATLPAVIVTTSGNANKKIARDTYLAGVMQEREKVKFAFYDNVLFQPGVRDDAMDVYLHRNALQDAFTCTTSQLHIRFRKTGKSWRIVAFTLHTTSS